MHTDSFEREIAEVIDFLRPSWGLPTTLACIVECVAKKAYHEGRGMLTRFSSNYVTDKAKEARKELLRNELERNYPFFTGAGSYEKGIQILGSLTRPLELMETAGQNIDGPWDFAHKAKAAYSFACSQFAPLVDAQPACLVTYRETFDLEKSQEPLEAAIARFKGTTLMGIFSGSLVNRLQLSEILWAEEVRRASPALTLVEAIYAHFLLLRRLHNDADVARGVQALADQMPKHMFFEGTVTSDVPFIQAALNVEQPFFTKADLDRAFMMAPVLAKMSNEEAEAWWEADPQSVATLKPFLDFIESPETDSKIFAEFKKVLQ